uniref:hypothetical protein n=1 Tax=Streptococcus pluranimalium TaxID=82348 RepID=UPI003F691E9F
MTEELSLLDFIDDKPVETPQDSIPTSEKQSPAPNEADPTKDEFEIIFTPEYTKHMHAQTMVWRCYDRLMKGNLARKRKGDIEDKCLGWLDDNQRRYGDYPKARENHMPRFREMDKKSLVDELTHLESVMRGTKFSYYTKDIWRFLKKL